MFTRDTEALKALLEKLGHRAREASLVVEGKKDLAALKKLGIKADFFIINKGKSLYESAEMIAKAHDKSLLCFDADKKGKELRRVFKDYLQKNGVKVDTKLGEQLLKSRNCRRFEELSLD
jgi:5S rRNA maturation endonuclease (ribonuclease M5)